MQFERSVGTTLQLEPPTRAALSTSRCYRVIAIGSYKFGTELGWEPRHTDFATGLAGTIALYRESEAWWRPAKEATEARYRTQGQ